MNIERTGFEIEKWKISVFLCDILIIVYCLFLIQLRVQLQCWVNKSYHWSLPLVPYCMDTFWFSPLAPLRLLIYQEDCKVPA